MKVFVTGASGFVGSAIVNNLVKAGHQVKGLVRSSEAATKVKALGADIVMGTLEDSPLLSFEAGRADGVIHTAFNHNFNEYASAAAADKIAIEVLGEALKGTSKPLIVTAGLLGLSGTGEFIIEAYVASSTPRASESTTMALAEDGINASVVRLAPSVHDEGYRGFMDDCFHPF